MRETPLQRHLMSGQRPAIGPIDVLTAARRRFLRGERVDMQDLARELGIGRATLYRWVGGREQLLGEILWSLAQLGLEDARASSTGRGPERLVRLCERFLRLTAEHGPLRRFVEQEPEVAMRVLMSKHGVQQRRLIDALAADLAAAEAAGELRLRLPAADLAYVIVRVGESFIWRELITGEEPDLSTATGVVRILLS